MNLNAFYALLVSHIESQRTKLPVYESIQKTIRQLEDWRLMQEEQWSEAIQAQIGIEQEALWQLFEEEREEIYQLALCYIAGWNEFCQEADEVDASMFFDEKHRLRQIF